ncbi:MAG: ParB/RepB/Spo0J family partition protein [Candidatus Cloacimonetes bacterium]|nr:ParB/RepB/Spo0J family partition protein [Candidatus Cloacimonadota bacterium]
MKTNDKKPKLTSYDEIFQTEEERQGQLQEKVMDIPLTELKPFKNHPFKVIDDEAMLDTADSIAKHGVLVPAIARPTEDGGFELIAGHRRKRASELAGKDTMPVIIRNLDDDEATIIMVDSNIQRENILPSERAYAYKLKLEAMKRKVGRPSLENVSQVGTQKRSDQIMAEQTGESRNQIQRYIRLTELTPDLLDLVDDKKIAFNPAVEISFLSHDEQRELLEVMDMQQTSPSLSQAQRMKKFSQEGKLSFDVMTAIMSEEKRADLDKITLTGDRLKKYFPRSYTPQQMEETIIKLLEGWSKKRQHSQER